MFVLEMFPWNSTVVTVQAKKWKWKKLFQSAAVFEPSNSGTVVNNSTTELLSMAFKSKMLLKSWLTCCGAETNCQNESLPYIAKTRWRCLWNCDAWGESGYRRKGEHIISHLNPIKNNCEALKVHTKSWLIWTLDCKLRCWNKLSKWIATIHCKS